VRDPQLVLALIGFGHVARRFVRLLDEVSDRLSFEWRLAAIATRHHGTVVDASGIDATRAVSIVEASQSLDRLDGTSRERR
jgi:homoserine dehydrogenase